MYLQHSVQTHEHMQPTFCPLDDKPALLTKPHCSPPTSNKPQLHEKTIGVKTGHKVESESPGLFNAVPTES